MSNEELITLAMNMREYSYAPYSNYKVGAALLTKSGKIYTGCNIENAAFSPSICAERTAFCKAISEGEKDFVKIAIVGGKEGSLDEICPPCGVCRQVMSEFCKDDFILVLGTPNKNKEYLLKDILPLTFSKDKL